MSENRIEQSLFQQIFSSISDEQKLSLALKCGDVELTYADLILNIEYSANKLIHAGAEQGDRIALMLGNSIEYVIAFMAITSIGAIAVPIDDKAGDERLNYIIKNTEPKFCLSSSSKADFLHAIIQNYIFKLDADKIKISITPEINVQNNTTTKSVDENSPALILFSAGSTGLPKAVTLQHNHLMNIAKTLSEIIGMDSSHRDLVLCPMTHSGGWQRVTSTLLTGGCVVIPEGFITVTAVLEDIQNFGITGFFSTPPLIRSLLQSDPEKIKSMTRNFRSIEIASAPLSSSEIKKLLEYFPTANVFFQYGLTECSRALILNSRENLNKLHTIGQVTHGVEIAIADENGIFLDANQEGEILLRASDRIGQYWNNEELNDNKFRDGWLLTGDFGYVDEDHFVVYKGRRDDMINCGGFSFFPAEVENEFGILDGVKEYLVAGVADPQKVLNQIPWIFIVPHDPGKWSLKQFLSFARKKLPAHMVPRHVEIISEIPRTPTGKPNRRITVQKYGPNIL